MTTMAMKDVGFCAHFSRQGDWAFEFALSLAKRLGNRLNIFYFPRLDWPSSNPPTSKLGEDEFVALDRRVREYYDDKLGDFVEVGFRVCEDLMDTELRRCLFRREYQVLVLAYPGYGAAFGVDTVESFAYRFNGPVVLVGPDRPGQLCLNPPAGVVSWRLGLSQKDWTFLTAPAEVGTPR
ncbi:MAG: universal stress protein [Planctomycetes bacterium]|nr:universal stress protein [Planctomycetota bacterium]